MGIRGIFFDAAGVLYHRAQSTTECALALLKEAGFAPGVSDEQRKHERALRSRANVGQVSAEEYWDQFLLDRGVSCPQERQDLRARILECAARVLPTPGVHEALAGLRRRGFVLGVVTNTMYSIETKMRWLAGLGIAEHVDAIACSTVVGAQKPDPGLYLDALRQTGIEPAEAAFVGHDATELAGAASLGMTTIAVHHDPGAQADYCADSLLDLLDIPVFAQRRP